MDFQKDYYSILGVGKRSSKEELKSAYRKLSMRYHPDKNPGNPVAEEKMKSINEAYQVLYNDDTRHIYDQYKKSEEKLREEESNAEATRSSSEKSKNSSHKRTYKKKTVHQTERRVYVRGTIIIKFWADQETTSDSYITKEINYRVNPIEAEAVIIHSDIYPYEAPLQFQKVYRENEVFKSPLPNPVKCRIISDSTEEFYVLDLMEIHLLNPILYDIVKHEKQSLGTLKAEFYGYVLRMDEKEIVETVTECFGETGRTERKSEEGKIYYRKEYYHKDCTTFWGPWLLIPTTEKTNTSTRTTTASTSVITTNGCAQWLWVPFLLPFLIIWPQFFLGVLIIGIIVFLLSLGMSILGRVLPLISLLLFLILIYAAFNSESDNKSIVKKMKQSGYDSISTTKLPIATDSASINEENRYPDTLVNHYIQWKDYDSIPYAITLSVSTADIYKSFSNHNSYELTGNYTSLAPVYNKMEENDVLGLKRIYNSFDSIRIADSLDEIAFAKMVVSCIQSIPYYLILNQSCSADYRNDEFIAKYLQQCDGECCLGNTKFGVRSPVEFMSDLKGDCDTRSLLLYSILKKFNYDVAILTSEYYKHALIGVSFNSIEYLDGLVMSINNKNYYLWETTNVGFQPGKIPLETSNLNYWQVALLNKK